MNKILTVVLSLSCSSIFAHTFTPFSGMNFSCYDNVSNLKYIMKIVDLGDQEGAISVYNKNILVKKYKNVSFYENNEESYFIIFNNKNETFSVHFPMNELEEAYFSDLGDSRSLDCKML